MSRETEFINVSVVRENIRAMVGSIKPVNQILHPGNPHTGKMVLLYSTRTTDVFVFFYRVNRTRYADVFVFLASGRQHYTAKKQFAGYVGSAMKRVAYVVRKLRARGWRVGSSQIICAGNFTRECITVARKYRRIEDAKVTTSVRVIPVKPVRKHRIGRFVIKDFYDVQPVVLFWLGKWIHERSVKLMEALVGRGVSPKDDHLWTLLYGTGDRILNLVVKLFGKDVLDSLYEGVGRSAG